MKYAIVNDQRQEAERGLVGVCPDCKGAVLAKCGEIKMKHWAHRGGSACDSFKEPETPWHREWKEKFPENWQEIHHISSSGEIHRADVKTDKGWVFEFQNSPISPDERRSRDAFYNPKLIWVINGKRLKFDEPKFERAVRDGKNIDIERTLTEVASEGSALLRDWAECLGLVFFDFGGAYLWWIVFPDKHRPYLSYLARSELIEMHTSRRGFEKYLSNRKELALRLHKRLNPHLYAASRSEPIQTQDNPSSPPLNPNPYINYRHPSRRPL